MGSSVNLLFWKYTTRCLDSLKVRNVCVVSCVRLLINGPNKTHKSLVTIILVLLAPRVAISRRCRRRQECMCGSAGMCVCVCGNVCAGVCVSANMCAGVCACV